MVIGSVLVQPQRIRRAADEDAALVQDILRLGTTILADAQSGGQIIDEIGEAMEAVSTRMQQQAATGFAAAQQRLRAWLQPTIDRVLSLGENPIPANDQAAGIELGQRLLSGASDLAPQLTLDRLRSHLSLVLDVLETDLGVTSSFIEDQIWALIDDLVARLEQPSPGLDPPARERRLETASVLRRLKRRFQDSFVFPEFDAEHIARLVLDLLRDSGIDSIARRAACSTDRIGGALETGTALTQLVPFGGSGGGAPFVRSLGAMAASEARETYAWYATWLLQYGDSFGDWFLETVAGWPGEKVFVNRERTRVMRGDQPLISGTNLDWTKAPIFDRENHPDEEKFYIFRHISPQFMDDWAFHTSWVSDGVRLVWHLTNIQPDHQIAPILNGAYDAAHLATKLIARRPFSGFHFFSHKWLDWISPVPLFSWGAPVVLTTAGSLQGKHTKASATNQFLFWLTVWLGDFINLIGPVSLTNALRDASLSFMTLLNFGGPRDAPSTLPPHPAQNHNEIDGIVNLAVTGVSYWLASMVERRDYVNPTGMPGNVAALWLLGGTGMGLLGGFLGTLVAEIVAWAEDWGLLGRTMLKSIPKVLVYFWPLLYSLREGDTDGGRFNAAGAAFRGYPTKTRSDGTPTPSPYLLPYAAGVTYNCGQANAGMWSHNRIFNPTPAQTYAYDFAFDQADEILASRPGTVVSFFEGTPDDTTGTWNNIVIRHDVDDDGNLITPDPDHDLDVNGNPAVTFAVYGHGRQNGVTNAFANWTPPVPTASIVGTRVKRGQPIMLAGDTGTSFYNHLHMHVLAETRPGGTPTVPATNAVQNNAYTIPFIFQDVAGDGVCKHLHWYTSTNTRRTA